MRIFIEKRQKITYKMIITAVEKPSLAPSVNTEYTGTFLIIAYSDTHATSTGIDHMEIVSKIAVIVQLPP